MEILIYWMRIRMRVLFAAAAVAAVLLATVYVAKFGYPFFGREGIAGIDISHHQGPRDWDAVTRAGVRFAYIKATEGADWKDGSYRDHEERARIFDLTVGAYHFFTFCADGKQQAANFVKHIDLRPGDLPPVVDVEAGGNCMSHPDPETLRKSLREFMAAVVRATGREPLIYTTRNFYEEYFLEGYGTSRFWIRNLFRCPEDTVRFPLCQYSVAKIKGAGSDRVDRNVFRGSEAEWQRFLIRSYLVVPP